MRGIEFVRDLCDALGFPWSGVSRIVIVADVREVPRVYVRGPVVAPEKLTAVVGALRVAAVGDVAVTDWCEVVVVPPAPADEPIELPPQVAVEGSDVPLTFAPGFGGEPTWPPSPTT